MYSKQHRYRQGFTLVEVMIVVAIIAMLAALAVPSFLRARKRSQATSSLETLRMVDGAKEQYAIENNKSGTVVPGAAELAVYVKKGTKLYTDLLANNPSDALGAAININSIDTPPSVAAGTKTALQDVLGGSTGVDAFFGAYK